MAAGQMKLKSFHDVRDFLMLANNCSTDSALPPKPNAFMVFSFPNAPKNRLDLVFEGIYLGDESVAKDTSKLKSLGITHVVNASHGTKFNQTNTDAEFYKPVGIDFHGIPALDVITYKILPHLRPAADFMHRARQNGGIVYVHCQQGVSRSATVVLAYLMLHWDMGLLTAVKTVREKREIFPNEGFLKQLCLLEKEIQETTDAVST